MSKAKARNGFYYFMLQFREEQKASGVLYTSMADVAEVAGPVWKNMPDNERKPFENQAKEAKKTKVPTKSGPIARFEALKQDLLKYLEAEHVDIGNFIKECQASKSGLLNTDLFLIDVTPYCYARGKYVIGECSVLRFTIQDGIKDFLHKVVNPGLKGIPFAFDYEVKKGSQEFGLPKIEYHPLECTDYAQLLSDIMDYTRGFDINAEVPRMYTMPDKLDAVCDFIMTMCDAAHVDYSHFRVYRLDCLFYQLLQNIPAGIEPIPRFEREHLALEWLASNRFKLLFRLCCKIHYDNEKTDECSRTHVQRWAYLILYNTCQVLGIKPVEDCHEPNTSLCDRTADEAWDTIPVAPSQVPQTDIHTNGIDNTDNCEDEVAGSTTAVAPTSHNNIETFRILQLRIENYGELRDLTYEPPREQPLSSAFSGRGRGRLIEQLNKMKL